MSDKFGVVINVIVGIILLVVGALTIFLAETIFLDTLGLVFIFMAVIFFISAQIKDSKLNDCISKEKQDE